MAMKSGKDMQPPKVRESIKSGALGGPVAGRSDSGMARGMQSSNPVNPRNPMKRRKSNRSKGV